MANRPNPLSIHFILALNQKKDSNTKTLDPTKQTQLLLLAIALLNAKTKVYAAARVLNKSIGGPLAGVTYMLLECTQVNTQLFIAHITDSVLALTDLVRSII